MTTASLVALILGILLILEAGLLWKAPDRVRGAFMAYPRMRLPAQVLTALCLIWFARNLWLVDFGGFSFLKNGLYLAVPLGWFLIVTYIPDLLAVRALCGLLLLGGNPLLVAVRWQGFPSWVVGILIYVVMVKAMFLAVYPHYWKRGGVWLFAKPGRVRTAAAGEAAIGVLILASAFVG